MTDIDGQKLFENVFFDGLGQDPGTLKKTKNIFVPVWEDVLAAMCPDNVVMGGHVVHQAGQVELPLLLDVEVVGLPQEPDWELQHCQPAPDQPYSNSETFKN